MSKYRKLCHAGMCVFVAAAVQAAGVDSTNQSTVLEIRADQPGHPISKTQYGVFFEELSHAGDGGLYAELVRNRSFEDNARTIPSWKMYPVGQATGRMELTKTNLLNAAQSSALEIIVTGAGGTVGVANEGYWGISVVKGRKYDLSFFAKSGLPADAVVTAKLQSSDGKKTFAVAKIGPLDGAWKKYTAQLTADGADPKGRLALEVTAGAVGSVCLDVVSLFPPTWKGRPNGLRLDLAEMIAAMKPGMIRFPGGAYVSTLPENAPRWQEELGQIEERPGHPRPGRGNFWGYHNTDGFGLHEYLQFAEDLGAEPIYVFQAGCDSGSSLDKTNTFLAGVALDKLIEEILAGIEYINGDVTTEWGAKRAANGHPAPFNMKYVQIGNENVHKPYHDNYIKIYDAIKKKYPQLKVIWAGVNGGNNPFGYKNNGIMPEGSAADVIDEHYYWGGWMRGDLYNKNSYPRGVARESKIFVGEYSSMLSTLEGALQEAAFMIGVEQDSDKVVMSVYAPLLCNVNQKNWPANAIYFDSSRVYGTPSYYTQVLLGNNVGDVNIGVSGLGRVLNKELLVNANLVQSTGEVIIKMVNKESKPRKIQIKVSGVERLPSVAREIVLTASDKAASNTFDNATCVVPVENKVHISGNPFEYEVKPDSFTVLRLGGPQKSWLNRVFKW